MLIHKITENGSQQLDVQPHRVDRYVKDGWNRGPAPKPELDDMKRDELNEHARSVGVESPEKLPNIDAVKQAIADKA